MSENMSMGMVIHTTTFGLIIDIAAIVVGLFAIALILSQGRLIGGKVKQGINLFMGGVVFMISAHVYTILATRMKLIVLPYESITNHDIHSLLMLVGIVFFILSAREFTRLVPR